MQAVKAQIRGDPHRGPDLSALLIFSPSHFARTVCHHIPTFSPQEAEENTHAKTYKQTYPRQVKPDSPNLQLQQKRKNECVFL